MNCNVCYQSCYSPVLIRSIPTSSHATNQLSNPQHANYHTIKPNTLSEERGKKKKKKKQWLKKLAIFGLIVAKLCLLLKLIQAGLILKLTLIGLGILIVSVAKLVILIKQGHKKTIYYENSHHDHHYENEDVWEHDHGHWDRSLDGQKLAYSGQLGPNSQ